MKKKKIIFIVIMIIAALISYFAGFRTGYQSMQNTQMESETETFYAEITNINNNVFTVDGVEMNDINHRGEFNFEIASDTRLVWNGVPFTISELDVGDHIAITYQGGILETYPAQITDVVEVHLLDDEK